jgi:hypothetical protein
MVESMILISCLVMLSSYPGRGFKILLCFFGSRTMQKHKIYQLAGYHFINHHRNARTDHPSYISTHHGGTTNLVKFNHILRIFTSWCWRWQLHPPRNLPHPLRDWRPSLPAQPNVVVLHFIRFKDDLQQILVRQLFAERASFGNDFLEDHTSKGCWSVDMSLESLLECPILWDRPDTSPVPQMVRKKGLTVGIGLYEAHGT